jgi:hypothetical protein
VLDFADEAFDAVAQFIGRFVIGETLAKGSGRDDGVALGFNEVGAKVVAVVALVSDKADEWQPVYERNGLRHLVNLARRENEA